jgi:uncharacterized membrane protein
MSNAFSFTTRRVVLAALFGALVVVLKLSGIGVIPLPNLSGGATIYHVPVIIGAIVGGPLVGMFAGLVMGVLLLIDFPAFGPLVMLPGRILIGLEAWLIFELLTRARVGVLLSSLLAGISGALTNTVVTLGLAIAVGLATFEQVLPLLPQAGIEAILGAVICALIVPAVKSVLTAAPRAG